MRVYSNCERVELFVNGRSQGTKFLNPTISPAGGLVWFVPFNMGSNEIRAVGVTTSGKVVEHAIDQTLVSNGVTEAVRIEGWCEHTSTSSVTAPSTSLVTESSVSATLVIIQLTTADGVPVLTDEHHVCFELAGSGKLLTNQGTPSGSRIVETANGRASIYVFGADATTQLTVTSENLPSLIISC